MQYVYPWRMNGVRGLRNESKCSSTKWDNSRVKNGCTLWFMNTYSHNSHQPQLYFVLVTNYNSEHGKHYVVPAALSLS